MALRQQEDVNCPAAAAEALDRQNELARLTGELASHSFGGFNVGTAASAVNPTALGFGAKVDRHLPGPSAQPFPTLTAANNFRPGLPGFLPGGVGEEEGEGGDLQDRRILKTAALKGVDEETREKRTAVLLAAGKLVALYSPVAQNTAAKVTKTLKNEQDSQPGAL